MARFSLLLSTLCACSILVDAVSPIQKVLQIMEEMKAKGIQNKKDEEVRFSKFSQWCDDLSRQKKEAIETGAEQIEQLEADILKAETEITILSKAIAEAEEDITRWATDMKAVSEVREKEKHDYIKTHDDYAGSVDALERAIMVLKRLPESVPQALLQTSLKSVAEDPRFHRQLAAF